MSADLQPFESHPASPGDLQAGANNLVQQGAEALQNADQTEIAYAPASDAVTGEPAPAIAVASDPVKARSLASSESLVWAGVAMKMWSEKVRDFNQQVEVIKYERMAAMLAADEAAGDAVATGRADPAAAAQEADAAKAKADEHARSRWNWVYTEQIIGGRSLVQSWLREGPTDNNLQAARLLNVMPDLRWGPLEALWKSLIGGNDISDIPLGELAAGVAGAAGGGRRGRGRGGAAGGRPRGEPVTRWTNAQARDAAARHGYRDTGRLTQGKIQEKVFYNPKTKTYISQDVGSNDGSGSHNGGRWKMATSPERLMNKDTRLGTYDEDLKRVGD